MKIIFFLSIAFTVFVLQIVCPAQTAKKTAVQPSPNAAPASRSSPAYAEILLRKTELEADLEDLMVNYTEDYPKVKETRYEFALISAALDKISIVSPSESPKLTLALGKLIVRKAELETDLWSLKTKYGDEHADVKRAARKVAVFEKAIKEILP